MCVCVCVWMNPYDIEIAIDDKYNNNNGVHYLQKCCVPANPEVGRNISYSEVQ
jgi:hypothetical protein